MKKLILPLLMAVTCANAEYAVKSYPEHGGVSLSQIERRPLTNPELKAVMNKMSMVETSSSVSGINEKSHPKVVFASIGSIERRPLANAELKSVMNNMAVVELSTSVSDISAKINKPFMVKSVHQMCIDTFLSTDADYEFNLDVGGKQRKISGRIVLPARERTCIQRELYEQVSFASAGKYMFTASTNGGTWSSGMLSKKSDAFITVE